MYSEYHASKIVNYDSQKQIKAVLAQNDIKLKRRWGQNFLVNRGAREKIIGILCPEKNDTIWEIGPGLGSMVALLIPRIKQLICFEIDNGLICLLKKEFAKFNNLIIYRGDVIKTWQKALKEQGMPCRVFGNLPYSSASLIISSFIENSFFPERLVFTVQRELAKRISAVPSTKNYSSFSILCQSAFKIIMHGDLKAGSFFPAPRVVSTIIELLPNPQLTSLNNRDFFYKFIRLCFKARRKTLKNNILHTDLFSNQQKEHILNTLQHLNISEELRADSLPVASFIEIARHF